ncbi:hypothetical protein D3C80_1038310 [compost metagenome]
MGRGGGGDRHGDQSSARGHADGWLVECREGIRGGDTRADSRQRSVAKTGFAAGSVTRDQVCRLGQHGALCRRTRAWGPESRGTEGTRLTQRYCDPRLAIADECSAAHPPQERSANPPGRVLLLHLYGRHHRASQDRRAYPRLGSLQRMGYRRSHAATQWCPGHVLWPAAISCQWPAGDWTDALDARRPCDPRHASGVSWRGRDPTILGDGRALRYQPLFRRANCLCSTSAK